MLQVNNKTPFAAAVTISPDADGIDALVVAVKGTFAIGAGQARIAGEQPGPVPADIYWGEPSKTSLRYAGELHPPKKATDVVLVGDGFAPGGRPAPYFGVSLTVGKLEKTVHVFGDRVWKAGLLGGASPSEPTPATQVPLRFERAYGGSQDLPDGELLAEMHNPVGVGFQGKRKTAEMNGTPVPNLEDPRHPVHSLSDKMRPMGVGHVAPWWQPRAAFAGTYDETWKRRRAPFLPADFNPRFWQTAPEDQIYPGHLQGGEPVELVNLSPAGIRRFALPVCRLGVAARIRRRIAPVTLVLDTLLLEPAEDRFSLLWHGTTRCDKEALQIEEVSVVLDTAEGACT